jgi:hypothetical protein
MHDNCFEILRGYGVNVKVLLGCLLVCAHLSAIGVARGDELAGHWSGTWTKADDPLAVTVAFERAGDRYIGAFDSDALQVAEIPFADVRVLRARIRFTLTGDAVPMVFDGTLVGDELAGTFTEGKVAGTFQLVRTAAPASILKREVTFANADVTLAGELMLPEGPGRHAAVVFLHDAGDEGRQASRYLAKKFATQGFVTLSHDKRGVGKSTGDWRQSNLEDLAGDAVAAVRFLQTQPEVDPTNIGVYGRGRGGTISPLVAVGEPTLGFIIASAACGLDPAEAEAFSIENSIGVPELADAERDDARRFVREIVEVVYRGKSRDDLDAMSKEFGTRTWYFTPPPPGDPYWALSKWGAAYRPLDYWRQVRAPVMLVFGTHDERVPPVRSADAIVAALKSTGNTKVTLKMFANADHAFKVVPQSPAEGWTKHVPEYAGTLVNWARAQD